MIKFGSAANPDDFYEKGYEKSEQMPKYLHEFGLDAYEYQFSRGVRISDEKANKIKEQGIKYYEYYAITLGETEKYYVSTYEQAKEVVNQLKEKKSNNIDELGMVKKYSTELQEFTSIKRAVSKLYE